VQKSVVQGLAMVTYYIDSIYHKVTAFGGRNNNSKGPGDFGINFLQRTGYAAGNFVAITLAIFSMCWWTASMLLPG
jgi:hypothetical protein